MQRNHRKMAQEGRTATVTPLPRGISTSGTGRYTGSREPGASPSRAHHARSGWSLERDSSTRPRSLTVAGAAQAFHLFPDCPAARIRARAPGAECGGAQVCGTRTLSARLRLYASTPCHSIRIARCGIARIGRPPAGFPAPCQPFKAPQLHFRGRNALGDAGSLRIARRQVCRLDAKQHSKLAVSS